MDTLGNNLTNYIKSLENALQSAREGASSTVDIEKVFMDLEECKKNAQFLLSDDPFPYSDTSKASCDCTHIMDISRIGEDTYKFVLDKLLPHRLDYHKLTHKVASRINQSYAKSFERDIFDFCFNEDFKKYDDTDKVVVVFINYYNSSDSSTWDNDNLDVKVFIDYVISGKFIVDDSHEHLSYCMLSKEGKYTHTEVYLTKESNLGSILALI